MRFRVLDRPTSGDILVSVLDSSVVRAIGACLIAVLTGAWVRVPPRTWLYPDFVGLQALWTPLCGFESRLAASMRQVV